MSEAGVLAERGCSTKPRLARVMLRRLARWELPARWVTVGEVREANSTTAAAME